MSAPSHLVWSLVKDTNAYIIKSNGHVFSKDPNNLVNKNSFKYSSLAQPKSIGVQSVTGAGKKGVTIVVSKKKAVNKPASKLAVTTVTKAGSRRAAKAVFAVTKKSGYRPDLEKAALARVCAVLASQKAKKAVKTGRKSLKQ